MQPAGISWMLSKLQKNMGAILGDEMVRAESAPVLDNLQPRPMCVRQQLWT